MRKMKTGLALTALAVGLALTGAGSAAAGSTATGAAANSPGFLSGNVIEIPIHIPLNLCGNSINVIALLNPAFGNHCVNR
ncbi:chaplin [Streptacidiphilus sp. P02-A3a]|uniref:chaplin n=1 Tax=Streptacidiphilus sp. P02-A3a TaxID=2704468 RepID=UPI0015FB0C89|nr:chaplin [Streptacidiphilus sp. P02-A3a]QMU72949.1 chaplin [Streptacidiphilus sp. P02-A3a]